jgi:hypothetical protein
MNDADIQLISSLIAGDLAPDEAIEATSRIEASAELRAAYDEQLAMATMLRSAPAVEMTGDERNALHAALRSELKLDETTMSPATTRTRNPWWLALGGLTAAAAAVFAFAVVPNLIDDGSDIVGAPAAEQTSPSLDTFSDGSGDTVAEPDTSQVPPTTAREGESVTTTAPVTTQAITTTAVTDETETTETTQAETAEPVYFLAPVIARTTSLELPVIDPVIIAASGLQAAIAQATEFVSLQFAVLAACFTGESGSGEIAVAPAGIDAAGSMVFATATHVESGDQEVVAIDLDSCAVTKAG